MNGFLVIAHGALPDLPLFFRSTCDEARAAAKELVREFRRDRYALEMQWGDCGEGLACIEFLHIVEFVNGRCIGFCESVELDEVDDDESTVNADMPS